MTERLLRRDRWLVAGLLALLFALAAVYTVLGVGMRMSALEMTAMRGMPDMPAIPEDAATRDAMGSQPPGGATGIGGGAQDTTAGMPAMPEDAATRDAMGSEPPGAAAGMGDGAQDMTTGMPAMPVQPGGWSPGYAALVFLMWWVMMIAMMLPSVAPVVLLYAALGRRGASAAAVPRNSAAFLAGYLLAWALFSALATTLQGALETRGLVSASMMTLTGSTAGALVLIAAGVFQFTPLKQSCLRHCRAPAEFLTSRRRPGPAGALRMGMEHSSYCLGCCWFLMALLFVGGIMNLYWIVGLALWVAAEKYLPQGARVSKIAGAALILWGGAILLDLL